MGSHGPSFGGHPTPSDLVSFHEAPPLKYSPPVNIAKLETKLPAHEPLGDTLKPYPNRSSDI
jgi:hypothetical protein